MKTITESYEPSLPWQLRANFGFPFPVPVSRSLLFQLPYVKAFVCRESLGTRLLQHIATAETVLDTYTGLLNHK